MALPLETGYTAADSCLDCDEHLQEGTFQSAAGWYWGTYCACGPYSRETDYYATPEEARDAYEQGVVR